MFNVTGPNLAQPVEMDKNVPCIHHQVRCEEEVLEVAFVLFWFVFAVRIRQPGLKTSETTCKPCSGAASSPVCGSDGHNYASEVKRTKKHTHLHIDCVPCDPSPTEPTLSSHLCMSVFSVLEHHQVEAHILPLSSGSNSAMCSILPGEWVCGIGRAVRFTELAGEPSHCKCSLQFRD